MNQEIIVTPAQVRAARTARGERGYFRETFQVLPPNIDRRTPLEQWDAHVTRLCALAGRRAARR